MQNPWGDLGEIFCKTSLQKKIEKNIFVDSKLKSLMEFFWISILLHSVFWVIIPFSIS